MTLMFVLIHGAFFVYGKINPESFLAGDRSVERLQKINYVFNLNDKSVIQLTAPGRSTDHGGLTFLARTLDAGPPGDYMLQGALFALGDSPAVVSFQLLLLLLSIICIYLIVTNLGWSKQSALVAAIVYMFLPGSMIQAHQLSSEALYNPLLTIGFFLVIAFFETRPRYYMLLAGFILLSMAMLIRPQLSLYPLLLVLILAVHFRNPLHPMTLAAIPICFLLPVLWSAVVFQQTGHFMLGGQHHGPEIAFHKTAERMAVVGSYEFDDAAYDQIRMTPGEFVRYALDHPTSLIKLKAAEIVNLVLNPGAYSVVGHHLTLLQGGGNTSYWKALRDKEGISGMIDEILHRSTTLALVMFGSAIIWVMVLLVAVVGGIDLWNDSRTARVSRFILFSYLFYGLLIVLVSGEVRWAHRTPIEFIVAVFFAAGLERLQQLPRTSIILRTD